MSVAEAVRILRKHNRWRRGDESIKYIADPIKIGTAIDTVCDALAGPAKTKATKPHA